MLEHLSVFLENKPGKLNRIVELLGGKGVNLRAFSIAGAGSFGILKMLVDDPDKAAKTLFDAGLAVAKRRILVARIPDRPGALSMLMNDLSSVGVNVSDSYGFLLPDSSAAIALECDDFDKAEQTIRSNGLSIVTDLRQLEA